MIDYGYEDRLVDRIAAREAIAARLSPRQRRILSHRYHRGETYEEISAREGVTRTRIKDIHDKALHELRKSFAKAPKVSAAPPAQTTRDTPPVGFDKAEFLRHMQGLILRREREERERLEWDRLQEEAKRRYEQERQQHEFEAERYELERLIASEKAKNGPKPASKPQPQVSPPYAYYVKQQSHVVWNSPSYVPPPLPTADELCRIAQRALEHLLLCRPQQFVGTPWLGKWATSVVFTRDGGSVSEAMDHLIAQLPAHARLSAYPAPINDGVLGAHATTPYASLRVTMAPDGLRLCFVVTWDD